MQGCLTYHYTQTLQRFNYRNKNVWFLVSVFNYRHTKLPQNTDFTTLHQYRIILGNSCRVSNYPSKGNILFYWGLYPPELTPNQRSNQIILIKGTKTPQVPFRDNLPDPDFLLTFESSPTHIEVQSLCRGRSHCAIDFLIKRDEAGRDGKLVFDIQFSNQHW